MAYYSLGCRPLALRGPPVEPKALKCLLIGRDKGASPLINVLFNNSKVRRTLSSTNPSISKTYKTQEQWKSHGNYMMVFIITVLI